MATVSVVAKIVEDNTGVASEIPLLMTEEGELSSLTDYLLYLHSNGRSKSTLEKAVRAVAMLLDYMEANADAFTDPEKLFQAFVRRLYSGTASESGIDPSGLYWVPASEATVRERIIALTGFTDWLADTQGTKPLNPLRKATPLDERLNYAAWFRRNQNDFLGHIKDKSISTTVKRARSIKGRTPLTKMEDDAISFPNAMFEAFFTQGIGGAKDPRVALRDKLILLLMHGAGLRVSEAILPWVTDVFENPSDPSQALVRIYNEREGVAPEGWKSRKGERTRKVYLKEKFGRIPRCDMKGTQYLGWKSRLVDDKEGFLIAQWFPVDFAKVFNSGRPSPLCVRQLRQQIFWQPVHDQRLQPELCRRAAPHWSGAEQGRGARPPRAPAQLRAASDSGRHRSVDPQEMSSPQVPWVANGLYPAGQQGRFEHAQRGIRAIGTTRCQGDGHRLEGTC